MRELLQEVVLDDPHGVETHLLGEHRLLDRFVELVAFLAFGPRPGNLHFEEQVEPEFLHCRPPTEWSSTARTTSPRRTAAIASSISSSGHTRVTCAARSNAPSRASVTMSARSRSGFWAPLRLPTMRRPRNSAPTSNDERAPCGGIPTRAAIPPWSSTSTAASIADGAPLHSIAAST